jgi:hypothetical protein
MGNRKGKVEGMVMIKNYTSTVPVFRSVQYIEDKLVKHGATDIMKTYNADKRLQGICFIMKTQGNPIPFRLPVRVNNVEKVLKETVKHPRSGTYTRIREQAERTAWKIISDWVDIQITLIELQQVDFMEVFLPYVYNPRDKMTFYEQIKGNGYKLLTEG